MKRTTKKIILTLKLQFTFSLHEPLQKKPFSEKEPQTTPAIQDQGRLVLTHQNRHFLIGHSEKNFSSILKLLFHLIKSLRNPPTC